MAEGAGARWRYRRDADRPARAIIIGLRPERNSADSRGNFGDPWRVPAEAAETIRDGATGRISCVAVYRDDAETAMAVHVAKIRLFEMTRGRFDGMLLHVFDRQHVIRPAIVAVTSSIAFKLGNAHQT